MIECGSGFLARMWERKTPGGHNRVTARLRRWFAQRTNDAQLHRHCSVASSLGEYTRIGKQRITTLDVLAETGL